VIIGLLNLDGVIVDVAESGHAGVCNVEDQRILGRKGRVVQRRNLVVEVAVGLGQIARVQEDVVAACVDKGPKVLHSVVVLAGTCVDDGVDIHAVLLLLEMEEDGDQCRRDTHAQHGPDAGKQLLDRKFDLDATPGRVAVKCVSLVHKDLHLRPLALGPTPGLRNRGNRVLPLCTRSAVSFTTIQSPSATQ
jgi:hypothetical protein